MIAVTCIRISKRSNSKITPTHWRILLVQKEDNSPYQSVINEHNNVTGHSLKTRTLKVKLTLSLRSFYHGKSPKL